MEKAPFTPECETIRQRIDIQSVLNHYDRSRTVDYIRHQLSYAGAQSEIFTEKTIDSIFSYSAGVKSA